MYQKLGHLKWILPNAPHNHEGMTQAWYLPWIFSSSLIPRRVDDPDEDEEAEDEDGLLKSVDYLDGLVEKELEGGVDGKRIVVGGFSQGCAVSLLWSLVGRNRERVGGVVGLSGYLPLFGKGWIDELRGERKSKTRTPNPQEEKQSQSQTDLKSSLRTVVKT
jgi:predicted esterase